ASLTANAAWRQTLFATAGLRYNLLLGGFDDGQIAVRARLSAGQSLTAEYAYLAPTFDGDSIWNIFSTGAYHDFRAGHDITLGPGVRAHVRGFARLFASTPGDIVNGRDVGAEAPGGRTAGGATAGIEARRRRSLVRADGYVDAGFGGRKAGADISGRYAVRPGRWEIEGRLTGFDW